MTWRALFHVESTQYRSVGKLNTGQCHLPALLACLSRRPCSISSSNFLVRSSSSLSRLSFRLAILSRNASTDSASSLDASILSNDISRRIRQEGDRRDRIWNYSSSGTTPVEHLSSCGSVSRNGHGPLLMVTNRSHLHAGHCLCCGSRLRVRSIIS